MGAHLNLTDDQVIKIRMMRRAGALFSDLQEQFKVSNASVLIDILQGRSEKYKRIPYALTEEEVKAIRKQTFKSNRGRPQGIRSLLSEEDRATYDILIRKKGLTSKQALSIMGKLDHVNSSHSASGAVLPTSDRLDNAKRVRCV